MLSPAPNQRRILRIFSGGRCPAPAHIVRMCVRAKTCPLVRSRRKTTNPAPNGPVKVCPLVRHRRQTPGPAPNERTPGPAPNCGHFSRLPMPFCMCVRVSRDLSVAAGWPMLSPAPNQRRILRIFSGGRCPEPAHIFRRCVRAKTCPLVRSRRKTTNPAPNGPILTHQSILSFVFPGQKAQTLTLTLLASFTPLTKHLCVALPPTQIHQRDGSNQATRPDGQPRK